MSTFSLPRLINGGGLSKNKVVNSKFASLNNRQRPVSANYSDQFMKRKPLNRNGSIVKNQFRGIRKDYLDTQTKLIIHSMTVSFIYFFFRYIFCWVDFVVSNLNSEKNECLGDYNGTGVFLMRKTMKQQ